MKIGGFRSMLTQNHPSVKKNGRENLKGENQDRLCWRWRS